MLAIFLILFLLLLLLLLLVVRRGTRARLSILVDVCAYGLFLTAATATTDEGEAENEEQGEENTWGDAVRTGLFLALFDALFVFVLTCHFVVGPVVTARILRLSWMVHILRVIECVLRLVRRTATTSACAWAASSWAGSTTAGSSATTGRPQFSWSVIQDSIVIKNFIRRQYRRS